MTKPTRHHRVIPRRIEFDAINAAARARLSDILQRWLPEGRIEGREYIARNPTRSDRRPGSFKVNTLTGVWADFATDDRGGDPISLVAYLEGCRQSEAAERLAQVLGLCENKEDSAPAPSERSQGASPKTAVATDSRPFTPVPQDAPPPPKTHPKRGHPSKVWVYRNQAGEVLGYFWRFDERDGRKSFLPLTWQVPADGGPGAWRFLSWEGPRPLYGLDRLSACPDGAPVVVVEGEKAADAAQQLLPGLPCVTSPNGSNSARCADWQPLANRRVILWPDADAAGDRYVADAIEALEAVNADVWVIEPPYGVTAGWDAADALAEGWEEFAADALVADAQPAHTWRSENTAAANRSDEGVSSQSNWERHKLQQLDPSGDCPLTPLGHCSGTYWFLSPAGEVRQVKGEMMGARALSSLVDGDVAWFVNRFEANTRAGFNEFSAADFLRCACASVGLFDPTTLIRGPGVWRDGDALLVHAGDALLIDGVWKHPGLKRNRGIYSAAPAIERPAAEPAGISDGQLLLEALRRWNFRLPIGPEMVLGFIGQAFLAGALEWRAHMLVTGEYGCGKTWLKDLVAAALGGAAHEASSDYTEAGLRQALTGSARTLLLDEAEREEGSARVLQVIRLLRSMSGGNGAVIRRGTSGGAPQGFRMTGAAFLVAVLPPSLQPQDRSRITELRLARLLPEVSAQETQHAISAVGANAPKLWARAIAGWPRFLETVAAYRGGLSRAGCAAREADQLSALAAGRDLLLRNDVPQADQIDVEVERLTPLVRCSGHEAYEGEGTRCWTHLITSPAELGHSGDNRTIVGLLQEALRQEGGAASKGLERVGVKIARDASGRILLVANRHSGLERIFMGTRWADGGWKTALRYLDGARTYPIERAGESVPSFDGSRQRATAIPATLVDGDDCGESS